MDSASQFEPLQVSSVITLERRTNQTRQNRRPWQNSEHNAVVLGLGIGRVVNGTAKLIQPAPFAFTQTIEAHVKDEHSISQ